SREYAVDPSEILFVREVMRNNIVALPGDVMGPELGASLRSGHSRRQLLYPIIDKDKKLLGVVTRNRLEELLHDGEAPARPLRELANADPVVAYADEPLRMVVYRMAETGVTRMPVLEREDTGTLPGMGCLSDPLRAPTSNLQ